MKIFIRQKYVRYVLLSFISLSLLFPTTAHARAVDQVKFKQLPDGYEITINFLFAIQYQSHTPDNPANELHVQLKTIDFKILTDLEVDSLRERLTWGPDPTTNISLREIVFEGGDPERPQMTFLFTEEVECDVHSSADLRSLIVKVKTKQPPVAVPGAKAKVPEKSVTKKPEEISLPEKVIPQEASQAMLTEEARDALIKGEFERSIQLYTKILETAQGPVKQQAQELLGVARERNKQFAHAKAEYEKYLKEFLQGPDADRVRQRLAGLITAAETPKERLKEARRKEVKGKWLVQNYGSFSQFYFRDQTVPEGGETRINRSDLSSDLDLNSRWRNDDLSVNARFTGGRQNNFLQGKRDQNRLSALSIDMRSKEKGLYGKLGRQTLSTGGVFGRFDGTYGSVKLNPVIKLNGVLGYPVESVRQTSISSEKHFYGLNLDFGTFLQKWDFNTFLIGQQNSGLIDRRALGLEVRYFDPKKAFFTLFDYDIFFNALNIFLFNGHWTLPSKTTLNFIFDYRKSPLLTLNNAIIGQGVDKISDLKSRFSNEELKQLARDRTTDSKSVTFGITQDLKKDWQLNTEVSLSELEGTVSSAGVEGEAGTGWDSTYSAQLIGSNVFKENDVVITGISFANTKQNNTYSLNLNGSFPLTQKVRVIPKFRVDLRDAKKGNDIRVSVRPAARIDYNLNKWLHFEVEGGIEQVNENSSGAKQKSTGTFISVGFRINF